MSSGTTYDYESTSPEATSALGEKLASRLQGGETIVLVGDLGAGKTQFVRGLAKGLGSDDVVQSPTFTLSREYACAGSMELHHYDFYRLGEAGIVGQEFSESIEDSNVTTVVEWSDIVANVLPEDAVKISIISTDLNQRMITATIEL